MDKAIIEAALVAVEVQIAAIRAEITKEPVA